MVGQIIDVTTTGTETGEFQPIPKRIQDLPELIIEPGTEEIREQMTESLMDLGARLLVIHMTAAEAFLSLGMYAESVPHVEAAVAMDPQNLDNIIQLGYVRYLAGDDEAALEALESVIHVDPENSDALYNVGMITFGQEELARSESCFRACTQLDRDNPEVWNNLGVVLFRQGNGPEARDCFEKTLSIDPENEDAQFNLANIG